jgi:hypothetical protein
MAHNRYKRNRCGALEQMGWTGSKRRAAKRS